MTGIDEIVSALSVAAHCRTEGRADAAPDARYAIFEFERELYALLSGRTCTKYLGIDETSREMLGKLFARDLAETNAGGNPRVLAAARRVLDLSPGSGPVPSPASHRQRASW